MKKILLFIFLLCSDCFASQYYVSNGGNDTNVGSITLPFKTIQKAATVMTAGDTCYVRAGTYRETVTPVNSGTEGNAITFSAYNNEMVVISGCEVITGWQVHSGNIYKVSTDTDIGAGLNMLYADGVAMLDARTPNAPNGIMRPAFHQAESGTYSGNDVVGYTAVINSADLVEDDGYWNGAIIHAVWGSRYHAITGTIDSYTTGTMNISLHCSPRHGPTISGCEFYIIGPLSSLDSAGEWYLDTESDLLYFWAPDDADPSTLTTEVKTRQVGFDLNGKSYINITGIDLFACNITTDNDSSYITIDGIEAKYPSHYTKIDVGDMGEGEKGGIDTGIILDGSHNTIQNSTVSDSAGNCVALLGDYCVVDNCILYNANYNCTEASNVCTGVRIVDNTGAEIKNSTIYNSGRCLVNFAYSSAIKITNNEFYGARYGWEVWDLGDIYTILTDGTGSEIAYNHHHDSNARGIYLDNSCSNYLVHHNLVEKTSTQYGLFLAATATGNRIFNNTIEGPFTIQSGDGNIVRNNIFGSIGTQDADDTYSNNLNLTIVSAYNIFNDYDNNDFSLFVGSIAINGGYTTDYSTDIAGTVGFKDGAGTGVELPDIGAYEFVKLFSGSNTTGSQVTIGSGANATIIGK